MLLPLNSERGLISLRENVELTDDPEEGEEDDAARHHRGVELDTPDAGWERGTPEQDGHTIIDTAGAETMRDDDDGRLLLIAVFSESQPSVNPGELIILSERI